MILAFLRLGVACRLRSFDPKAADTRQKNVAPPMGQVVAIPPPTTAPWVLPAANGPEVPWTIPHHNTRSESRRLRCPAATSHVPGCVLTPTTISADRPEERTRPL